MSKYKIVQTSTFKRNLKRIIKRGYNIALLKEVVDLLSSGKQFATKIQGS